METNLTGYSQKVAAESGGLKRCEMEDQFTWGSAKQEVVRNLIRGSREQYLSLLRSELDIEEFKSKYPTWAPTQRGTAQTTGSHFYIKELNSYFRTASFMEPVASVEDLQESTLNALLERVRNHYLAECFSGPRVLAVGLTEKRDNDFSKVFFLSKGISFQGEKLIELKEDDIKPRLSGKTTEMPNQTTLNEMFKILHAMFESDIAPYDPQFVYTQSGKVGIIDPESWIAPAKEQEMKTSIFHIVDFIEDKSVKVQLWKDLVAFAMTTQDKLFIKMVCSIQPRFLSLPENCREIDIRTKN